MPMDQDLGLLHEGDINSIVFECLHNLDLFIHTLKPTDEERLKAMQDCSLISGVHGDIGYPSTVELNDGSLLTVFYAHLDRTAPAEIFAQKWRFEK